MKIENEIEKSKKRITLLENQNARFKELLESALEVTNKSISSENLDEDDNEFWQETIKLIENEKEKLQEDLKLLNENEDDLTLTIKRLEGENLELQRKVEILLDHVRLQDRDMEKLKTEQSEITFLLTQPDSNPEWLKNILQLDDTITTNPNTMLLGERQKLQRKIMNLEQKKNEVLSAIEDITLPDSCTKVNHAQIKTDLEKALFKAIDDVAKKEYDALDLKMLVLEKERSDLLTELQAILDENRKKIAEEYCELQRNFRNRKGEGSDDSDHRFMYIPAA